uniref:Uncharacterized protein n=1 Tax=Panagrolaimus davidi TaxID=227884 RepID=A0A914QPN5_9BILA
MEHCYYQYMEKYDSGEDSSKYIAKFEDIPLTSFAVNKICEKFFGLKACLGGSVIQNCIDSNSMDELFDNGKEMLFNFYFLEKECEHHEIEDVDEQVPIWSKDYDIIPNMIKSGINILSADMNPELIREMLELGLKPIR